MTDMSDFAGDDVLLADILGDDPENITESSWRHYFGSEGTSLGEFDFHEFARYDGAKFRAVVVQPKQQYHIVSDVALSFGDWRPFDATTAATRVGAMDELKRIARRDEDE